MATSWDDCEAWSTRHVRGSGLPCWSMAWPVSARRDSSRRRSASFANDVVVYAHGVALAGGVPAAFGLDATCEDRVGVARSNPRPTRQFDHAIRKADVPRLTSPYNVISTSTETSAHDFTKPNATLSPSDKLTTLTFSLSPAGAS